MSHRSIPRPCSHSPLPTPHPLPHLLIARLTEPHIERRTGAVGWTDDGPSCRITRLERAEHAPNVAAHGDRRVVHARDDVLLSQTAARGGGAGLHAGDEHAVLHGQ